VNDVFFFKLIISWKFRTTIPILKRTRFAVQFYSNSHFR